MSLNRYERKKNIALAIDALHDLRKHSTYSQRVLLVIAGGYDLSVPENKEYLVELMGHCKTLKIPFSYTLDTTNMSESERRNHEEMNTQSEAALTNSSPTLLAVNEYKISDEKVMDVRVVFRTSISGLEREALLERAVALLYTPDR